MKELLFNTNGRPRAIEDLVMLQDQSRKLETLFAGMGNFVIAGCNVLSSLNGGVTILSGLVFLNGRIHSFPGGSQPSLPVELVSNGGVAVEPRNDKSGNPHFTAKLWEAIAQPLDDSGIKSATPKVRITSSGAQGDYYASLRKKMGLAAAAPTEWANLPFQAGSENFAEGSYPPQWRRDALGVVHLRGYYVVTVDPNGGYFSFVMPAGARPEKLWDVVTATHILNIYPDGKVMSGVSSRGLWVLDGVSFLAES